MENPPDERFVHHGSHERFESVVPKRQVRSRIDENGNEEIKFDEISFHATPYKWIALAYTYKALPYQIDGKTAHYGMGVSLYENKEEITIYGFNSLEESLEKMYGDGGYIYLFDKDKFFYTEGLGDLEVITKENIDPLEIMEIKDPVAEMKKLGIKIEFVDLAKPENEKFRNYY